jgi:SAM-dependent methyltransferase
MQPFALLWEFSCDGSIISAAATPNFSSICVATVGKNLYLLDDQGRPCWTNPFHVDFEAWATAISSDSQYIAVGTANKSPSDGTLYVLTRDQELVWSERVRAPIWSVSLSADGTILVASTWADLLYLFRRNGGKYERMVQPVKIPGGKGLYGAKLTDNGQLCMVASYDSGLFVVDQRGATTAKVNIQTGLYNLAIARDTNTVYVGTRDGSFDVATLDDQISVRHSKKLSQRPICGISVSGNGSIVACGSFDGRLIVSDDRGDALWDFQTEGEVWTTAISTNGALVMAGSGDHNVRLFRNLCDTSAYEEVLSAEHAVTTSPPSLKGVVVRTLTDLYLHYCLSNYGYLRLRHLIQTDPDTHSFKQELRRFLENIVSSSSAQPYSHFHLATLLMEENKYKEAAEQFQLSARSPSLRSSAQRKAAECFVELGLRTAATSAWRQSREQHLDDNARSVLFNLAQSYEDIGKFQYAAKVYETIVSWDVEFRNAWDKMETARGFHTGTIPTDTDLKDYTGLTNSLLGPDVPRPVDNSLKDVMKARSRETLIQFGDRQAVQASVKELWNDKSFSRGIRRDVAALNYDLQLFLKYDYGLPEDEMKKFLETVNALPQLKERHKRTGILRSLDIGCATGRYPFLLQRLGFEAYGIDVEQAAIDYCRKRLNGSAWPQFVCGDARYLDQYFPPEIDFSAITCMMGTFEHIARDDQGSLVKTIYQRLAPGGVALVSMWDVECAHLAYLSIYDENQKELIRQNSRTRIEIGELFRDAGFTKADALPFCLLPQNAIYDLGIERMRDDDITIAADADLATRALFSDRHGEMFLMIGQKQ